MERALDSDDRRLSLSVWWLLQLSWRFDHAVHGSWDRLRWTRAADRRRTASIPPRDAGRQLDWLDTASAEADPREQCTSCAWDREEAYLEALEAQQAGAACAWLCGREALHGQDPEDAEALTDVLGHHAG